MNLTYDLLVQGFSAFAGAFFAFLFLRIAEFFGKLYQRQVKHYNALVTLEIQLNEIGGIIHGDLYILPIFIRIITSGNVYLNNLHPIPVDKSHYANLYDLSLINELFAYNYQIRKINDDIVTTSVGYQDIKNALVQKHLTRDEYKENTASIAEGLKGIEIFLAELQNKTIELLARIRIQLRHDKPLGTKLQFLFICPHSKKITKEEILKETENLQQEIEKTKTESQKEIEAVLEKHRLNRR